ncbi:MAG: VWA domain-containing protein [Pseudomonadales bacterium]|nr:VWA domain-containing protein [Pseudomonadales bacterium]
MLEEIVGGVWHRFITQKAGKHYPEAAVYLEDIRHTAGIFFRALGGEGGLTVVSATDSEVHARRSVLQRIAGIGDKTQYAWRDEEMLRLPDSIALFPSKALNRDLYLWLTALSVIDVEQEQAQRKEKGDWISRNQRRTQKTLEVWPGLKSRYQTLLQAHLEQRPNPQSLSAREAKQELAIRSALYHSDQKITLEYAKRPPQPVPLWLHPFPPAEQMDSSQPRQDPDLPESSDSEEQEPQKKNSKRKQANREEAPDGKGGLMSFRLESLWSWGEYSKLDRSTTDEDDDDAQRTADDMDTITVAQDGENTAGKIKLDLDLPSSQYDDIVLGEGTPVDEWDYRKQRLQKDHCRIIPMESRDADPCELPQRLKAQARKIRRQLEILQPQRHWVSRQQEGSELDLENYVNFLADRKHGRADGDTPVYRNLHKQSRDLSCLLLADLSLSTDAYINNTTRVIDVVKDALFLFAEALSATGDHFALHGFSSRNRNHVRFYKIKNFNEKHGDEVRGFIQAVRPGYYTRMGAAIRHASQLLEQEATSQKLLLILTDGKPNDLDKYEGRYGLEDTRQAILEAEQKGLQPFCITIDEKAEDYLPYLFGKNSYILVRHIEELPTKLTQLYLRLTG